MLRTDPTRADTDADGMSDGYELGLRTNALKADTDGDGIGDSVELATGSDPTAADSDHDGLLDGSTSTLDSDHDGLADDLEQVLRTDPYSLDSDGDGFSDGLEYRGSFDPTDPLSTPLSGPLDPAGAGALSGSVPGGRLTPSALRGHGLGSGGSGARVSGAASTTPRRGRAGRPRCRLSGGLPTRRRPHPARRPARRVLVVALEQARRRNRDDLVERLAAERDRLDRPECTVVVVGEFDKGKSSLINALLNARVCADRRGRGHGGADVVRHGPESAPPLDGATPAPPGRPGAAPG